MTRLATPTEIETVIDDMGLPYLRVSLTTDCDAKCAFCHNEGQHIGNRGVPIKQTPTKLPLAWYCNIAKLFRSRFTKMHFTGGEPTLVSNLPEISHAFASCGYSTHMTSNGLSLDARLQTTLLAAGHDFINVSLHTLDEGQYERIFRAPGGLKRALANLTTLSKTFSGRAKINFVAIPNTNIPSQLVPMSELSAKLKIPISLLALVKERNYSDPISRRVISYLDEAIGITTTSEFRDKFGIRRLMELSNGATWEIDDFREAAYRSDAFSNTVCGTCHKKSQCTEGPYALRVHADGTLRPCLIRSDNAMTLEPIT